MAAATKFNAKGASNTASKKPSPPPDKNHRAGQAEEKRNRAAPIRAAGGYPNMPSQ